MYTSGPAHTDGGALSIVSAARRRYDQPSATAQDDRLPEYVGDMVRPYGLSYDNAPLAANLGQSFSEMCQPLIEEHISEPVDLLVLAFDLHDLRPGQATSIYLSHVCPGDPLAFTVCDQGNAAPFSALRLIQTYARTGAVRRALLFAAEQSTLHYELLSPAPTPSCHAATMFVLETGTGIAPLVRPAVRPDRVLAELDELIEPGETVIAGAGLNSFELDRLDAEVVESPSGQPLTGSWWRLAGALDQPVVLADYEPRLGYLSVLRHEPALVAAR